MMETFLVLLAFVVLAAGLEYKKLLAVVRDFQHRSSNDVRKFDREHYAKFEKALEQGDVEAYVYEKGGRLKGQVICLKGEELHAVTVSNLISFRKLNRADSRYLRKKHHLDYKENKTV